MQHMLRIRHNRLNALRVDCSSSSSSSEQSVVERTSNLLSLS